MYTSSVGNLAVRISEHFRSTVRKERGLTSGHHTSCSHQLGVGITKTIYAASKMSKQTAQFLGWGPKHYVPYLSPKIIGDIQDLVVRVKQNEVKHVPETYLPG
jgi:hypothetical protein